MLIDMRIVVVVLIGCIAGLYLLSAFAWSIDVPTKRIWPPKTATTGIKIRVWLATIGIFASTFVLGVWDWNSLGWPTEIRWTFGLGLIVLGNIVVWAGVAKIGMDATSGAVNELKTDGLYAYSRNPQYVADMGILLGWAILSASYWAIGIAAVGIVVLAVAPFSEEPWLEQNYGQQYRDYRNSVRRYF